MSKNKIRRKGGPRRQLHQATPKAVGPSDTIPNDADSVMEEYLRLGGELRDLNGLIRDAQVIVTNKNQEVTNLNNQGLQTIGQINMLAKIMRGMGIDPPTLDLNPPPQAPQPPGPQMPSPLPTMQPEEELEVSAEESPAEPTLGSRAAKISQISRRLQQ